MGAESAFKPTETRQRFAARQADVGAARAGRHFLKVNMANHHPNHFVVDGSNIATEGRSQPSLEQLNDAVLAFMKQFPDTTITVIVDATFGHRIDPKETKAFDEAVANNEVVAPPAGAIGRGDAFVLAIADQANAGILSNDSFQEFHGDYDWLFDEGRLVGGKPVPNVGWVFVDRTPVRGPKSKASMKASRRSKVSPAELKSAKEQAASRVRKKGADGGRPGRASDGADDDSTPSNEGRSRRRKSTPAQHSTVQKPGDDSGSNRSGRSRRSGRGDRSTQAPAARGPADYVNELLPFIEFVEHFPVGSTLGAHVDRYSSHGAYLSAHDVSLYLPLQYISDPAPNSARSVLKLGDEVQVVVVGFQPDRRSIDVATPEQAPGVLPDGVEVRTAGAATTAARGEASAPESTDVVGEPDSAESTVPEATNTPKKATTKKSGAKKSAARKAATKKSVAPTKTTAKKTAEKKATAKKSAAEADLNSEAATEKSTAKKAAAKKAPAKKATAKKTTAKKAPAEKASAKKATAKTASAKKVSANKAPAKKTPAKKAAAKKTTAKKSATKKTSAKKAAAKKSTAKKSTAV